MRVLSDYSSYSRKSGYAYLQNLVANVILKEATGVESAMISTVLIPQPSAFQVLPDIFGYFIQYMLPFMLVVIFMAPLYNNVFLLVQEKENRGRESMRMMGMTDTPYWLSWFTHYTLINTVLSLLAWGILCYNVISHSSKLLMLIFFWLYGESTFGFVLLFQTLFSRAKYSGYASALIYFAGYMAFIAVRSADSPELTSKLLSILPQVAAYKMCYIFG